MRRRSVLAGLAAAPVLASLPVRVLAAETLATSAGDVTITPVKHASLVLSFGDQVIYVDPSGADFSALPAATAVLVTHAHGDHFDVPTLETVAGDTAPILTTEEVLGKLPEGLKARATAIKNGESTTLNGIAIDAVAAYNTTPDRQKYHPQGVGNGYVVTLGDKRIYVAGDTEPTPEMLALKDIAVAFLPCNLPYTMTVEQLAEAIKTFRPAVTYPYHYGDTDLSGLPDMVGDASEVRLLDWYAA